MKSRKESSEGEDFKKIVSNHYGPVLDLMNKLTPGTSDVTKAAMERAAHSYQNSANEMNSISHELRKVLQNARMESDNEIAAERRAISAERMQLEDK